MSIFLNCSLYYRIKRLNVFNEKMDVFIVSCVYLYLWVIFSVFANRLSRALLYILGLRVMTGRSQIDLPALGFIPILLNLG